LKYYTNATILIFANVAILWCFRQMSRDVNKALPPGVAPFPGLVDRSRSFELIRLHMRMFPKSYLQELVVLLVLVALVCAFYLFT